MEKKEMSFKDKFQAAGEELEKEIKDGGAMILIATNGGDAQYGNIIGSRSSLSALLAFASLKADGFDEVLANAVKAIEIYREKHNK